MHNISQQSRRLLIPTGMRLRNATLQTQHVTLNTGAVHSTSIARRPRIGACATNSRKGVASVLAMIFLVVFSSLAVAMSVVAQGNLRTAQSALEVSRAMSAAETGLVFSIQRLDKEARRFITKKGVIDDGYAEDMWFGTYPGDGSVVVLDPEDYVTDRPNAGTGIMHALAFPWERQIYWRSIWMQTRMPLEWPRSLRGAERCDWMSARRMVGCFWWSPVVVLMLMLWNASIPAVEVTSRIGPTAYQSFSRSGNIVFRKCR